MQKITEIRPAIYAAVLMFVMMAGIRCTRGDEHVLKAGAAKTNITPSVPVRLSGFASRTEPYKGIHDELSASAIVFDDGKNKAALLSVEVIGFSHERWEQITSKIEAATGIRQDHILLAGVHTHGAPRTSVKDDTDLELIAYNQELTEKLIKLTRDAVNKLDAAAIGSGTGECRMNMNRLARDPDGGVQLGLNPYGFCDHTVGVVRIDRPDGSVPSIWVNWPCHGTVIGPKPELLTGDWPGAAARQIEKTYNDRTIASITAGASGNIAPLYRIGFNFGKDRCEEIGQLLAEETRRVAEKITTTHSASVSALQRTVSVPGKLRSKNRLPNQKSEVGPDVDIRLSIVKVGDIVFAGISGEVFAEIGLQVKENSPFEHTYVLTHCNGSSGYLITDDTYPLGGYEVQTTKVMPGVEGVIVSTITEMLKEI